MEGILSTKNFVFKFRSALVKVSDREEEMLTELINRHGALSKVPKGEVISVSFIKILKDKIITDEKFFYVPVNELKLVKERVTDKRRGSFLNFFSSQLSKVNFLQNFF